jgi:hypothetical protein
MLRCHTPSPAPAPHWHATGIDVGLQQRRAVLCKGGLLCVLMPRLLCVQGEYGVIYPRNLAQRIASRRHFLGSKLNQAEGLFEEGQRLYGEQCFSEAAERWGRAALLQHATSHAHLSNVLIEGKAGVAVDVKRAFALAAAGAALGCAHSKGTLGRCYAYGYGVAKDQARGLRWEGRVRRRAAALGSMWLECATSLVMAALRRTMPRLCDSSALQRHRGMQTLRTTWATCLRRAKALRRTMPRLCDSTALQQHRGLQTLSSTWAPCLMKAEVLRRTMLAAAQGGAQAKSNLKRLGA